jgi:hypothetical protein
VVFSSNPIIFNPDQSIRMKYLLLSVLLAAGYAKGCKDKEGVVNFNEDFILAPGEIVRMADSDIYLGFIGIAGESRCPTGTNCIRAGDVTVDLASGKDASSGRSFQMKLDAGQKSPNTRQLGSYTIELYDVSPYPSAGVTPDPSAYRVKLRVSGSAAM